MNDAESAEQSQQSASSEGSESTQDALPNATNESSGEIEMAAEVVEAQKRVEKDELNDKKREASQRIDDREVRLYREDSHTRDEAENIVREHVAEVATDPAKYNVSAILQEGERPQDIGVVLVLNQIAENAAIDKAILTNEAQLGRWIMELQTLVGQKSSSSEGAARREAVKYKRRLVQQLTTVVVSKSEAPNTPAGEVDRRRKSIEHWGERVGTVVTAERYGQYITVAAPPRAAENTTIDEETDFYQELPNDLQSMIHDINILLENDPGSADEKYFREKIVEVSAAKNISDEQKKHVVQRLGHHRRRVKRLMADERAGEAAERKRPESAKKLEEARGRVEERQAGLAAAEAAAEDEAVKALANEALGHMAQVLRFPRDTVKRIRVAEGVRNVGQRLAAVDRNALSDEDKACADEITGAIHDLGDFVVASEIADQTESQNKRLHLVEFLKDEADLEFLYNYLERPDKLIGLIMSAESPEEELDNVVRKTKRIFNQVFSDADRNPLSFFNDSFDVMRHRPAAEYVLRAVDAAGDVAKGIETKMTIRERSLEMQFQILRNKLIQEQTLRGYTHNVSYILQTRGELKDLAGYSEQLRAADLDELFTDEPIVMQAAQFFEQKVNQMLSGNNWSIPQEFMQSDPEEGGVQIDNEVIEMLKTHYKGKSINGIDVEEWELKRAYRLARGVHLGATAVVIDRLGEADPPSAREIGAFKSYFGEKILPAWNPTRFQWHRWDNPPELAKLIYAVVRDHGTMQGWDKKQLTEVEKKMKTLRGSQKWEYLLELGGMPFIEVQNMYGVGGPMSRGGWRFDGATYHMLSSLSEEELAVKRNEDPEYAAKYRPFVSEGGAEANIHGVDWDESWEQFRRAGSAVMLYWAKNRAKVEARYSSESQDDLTERYTQQVYEHINNMNPLKFAFFEKEEMYDESMFKGSIRGTTILKTLETGLADTETAQWLREEHGVTQQTTTEARIFTDVRDVSIALEERLLMVQGAALNRAQEAFDAAERDGVALADNTWEVKEEDFDTVFAEDSPERELVHEYWAQLKESIRNKTFKVAAKKTKAQMRGGKGGTLRDVGTIEYFAQRNVPYFLGSEDMDFSRLQFKAAGSALVGRAFGDANHFNEGIQKLFKIDHVLVEAGEKGEAGGGYSHLAHSIKEMVQPIEDLHGADKTSHTARMIATMVARYYQKNSFVRMFPAPISSMLDAIRPSTVSKELSGKKSWRWEEGETRQFIDALRQVAVLSEKDEEILRREVGARHIQVFGADWLRSTAVIVLLLMMFQGLTEEMKE